MPRRLSRLSLIAASMLVAALALSQSGLATAAMTNTWVTAVERPNNEKRWISQTEWVDVPVAGRLNDIDMLDASTGFAVGHSSSPTASALIEYHNGAEWTDLKLLDRPVELWGVSAVDATHVWAVGGSGTILKRNTSNTDWVAQTSPTGASLYSVAFADSTHGWAVGDSGTLIETTNGSSWSDRASGTGSTLRDVFALDSTHAWAVGDGGAAVRRLSDGSWSAGTVPPGTGVLRSVTFADATHGWAVGDGRTFLVTSDGGATWTSQTAPAPSSPYPASSPKSVEFLDALRGIAVGDHETVWRTANGGAEWQVFYSTDPYGLSGLTNLVGCSRVPGSSSKVIVLGRPDRATDPALPDKGEILDMTMAFSLPAAPSGLAFAPDPGATPMARLTWTDNALDETDFAIERGTSASGPFTQVGTAPAAATSYNDSSAGLNWTSTFYYRIRAHNQVGTGYSAYTAVVGGKLDVTPPAVWSNASTTPYLGTASITISGSDSQSGVSAYAYRTNGGPEQSGSTVNLGPGTYSLQVKARDVAGNWSAWSAGITVTVIAPATLSGTVSSGGSPLANATVNVGGLYSTTTAANGTYTITGIAPGTYNVTVSRSGYETWIENNVVFGAGATVPRSPSLTQNITVATLAGTVRSGGTGLSGATVLVNGTWQATTGASGTYTVNGITPGTYSVTYSKTGYAPTTVPDLVFGNGATVNQDASLATLPGTLSGTVTSGGSPLAGVTVAVNGTWSATTAADGSFSVPGITTPGTYSATFSKNGYAAQTLTGITWGPGETLSRTVSLTAYPATLVGTVTSTGGPALAGVTVTVGGNWSTTTDAAGTYTVSNVAAPGTYDVTFSKPGYATRTITGVAFAPGAATSWDVQLTPLVPLAPVYRFYNVRTGTHFYTISEAEKNDVVARLSWLYNLEGEAYRTFPTSAVDAIPLYRFYNMRTGTHFYTASDAERDSVIARLSSIYSYEGPAYFVLGAPGTGRQQVYRFYNVRAGVHFYTASEAERDSVIARLSSIYSYEGAAFNVPTVQ